MGRPRQRYLFSATVVFLATAAALIPLPAGWIEQVYSTGIYPAFQPAVTRASNLSSIALLDVGLAAMLAVAGAAFFRRWGAHGRWQAVVRTAAWLATAAAAIYLLFLASWGLNYRRVPLEEKLEFDRQRITGESARQLAALAIEQMNAGYAAAHAEALRVQALERGLAEAQVLLGHAGVAAIGRPKRSLAGIYFRYAAVDGMTVPIFLEIIVNPDLLPIELPSVLAHEWAHLAGYADESEASFVGWIGGLRSGDPVARYSAWLDAYRLAIGVLTREVRDTLPPLAEGPRQDLRAIAARYERSSPRVRAAARGVYDSYLKANRVEEGIASYDLALRLLLGTSFDERWTPRLRAAEETRPQ
jgi:hypothetical protein